jgi:hypothetical protein
MKIHGFAMRWEFELFEKTEKNWFSCFLPTKKRGKYIPLISSFTLHTRFRATR